MNQGSTSVDTCKPLGREERECIIQTDDANPRLWRVYVDKGHSMHALLRRLAQRLGAEVTTLEGGGTEFPAARDALKITAKWRGRPRPDVSLANQRRNGPAAHP